MHKKIIMACMAIAAFAAFVIAPAASATPVLTENGTALAVGSSVTGQLTGISKFTGGFGVECTDAHLQGTVLKNNGTEVEGTIPVGSAEFDNGTPTTPCTSALGNTTVNVTSEICMKNIAKADEISITGCGANPVTFDLTAAGITCKYSTSTIKGTFETNKTPAKVVLKEQPATEEEPRQFFCPDEGKLDMEFDLYTTGGTTGLTIS